MKVTPIEPIQRAELKLTRAEVHLAIQAREKRPREVTLSQQHVTVGVRPLTYNEHAEIVKQDEVGLALMMKCAAFGFMVTSILWLAG